MNSAGRAPDGVRDFVNAIAKSRRVSIGGRPSDQEAADSGRIFLEEITELSLEIQVALLRPSTQKEVGGSDTTDLTMCYQ